MECSPVYYRTGRAWLGLLLGAVAALNSVRAQDFDYSEAEVPQWLEDYGYEGAAEFEDAEFAEGRRGETFDLDSRSFGAGGRGAAASPGGASPGGQCNCLFCRDTLTGDWGGCRTRLRQRGIIYRGRTTQFFFGVEGGNQAPVPPPFGVGNQFSYTGNSRHDFLVDLDKFGGLPHSKFVVTLENIWGEFGNVSLLSGATSPPVFNAFFPVDPAADGVPRVTNFLLAQPLSERFILTVGKTRTIGVADRNIFAGGDGSDQFLNQSFIANPLFVPQLPLTSFSVGAGMPMPWGHIAFMALDPNERSTEFMDFGTLYSRGVILFGQVQVRTSFFGQPGQHHVGGYYKQVDLLDLRFIPTVPDYPYPPAPPGTPQFLTLPESYTIFYGFDQYLTTYGPPAPRGQTPGWGVFGRAGISDGGTGNPNYAGWHVSGGIGGDSPLRGRTGKGDRFGIGYGYTGASTDYGAIPQALFGPRDAQVVEIFYRYHCTPAIELTPDVQWVRGMLGGFTNGRDAFIYGLRLNMRL